MREDFYYPSKGAGSIHGCRWIPQGEPKAVVQIIHGISEYARRYEAFAEYLNRHGILVVAEDHMGHGQSINGNGVQGFFHGGWFMAAADSYQLLTDTKKAYPGLPYILFGHSMGSFLARTILCQYPDSGITGAIICGTGWQPTFALPAMIRLAQAVASRDEETKPSPLLQNIAFAGYNQRVEHPRTPFDWISRDTACVDAYIADPLCGFTASAGLLRDMMRGIYYIQQPENLSGMVKTLPVLFMSGGDDPVGNYGKGVCKAADAFRIAGMKDVSMHLYPMCRHEILNEINKAEVYADTLQWIYEKTGLKD